MGSQPGREKRCNEGFQARTESNKAYKAFLVLNEWPAFALPFVNALVRVGTQRLFRPCGRA